MTEATLNANNYIDICSIPSKFHMCMYEKNEEYLCTKAVKLTLSLCMESRS